MRSAFILAVLPRPLPGGHAFEVWGELDDVAVAFCQSDADGPEHMIRMAGILLDIADGTKKDFDELILEKRGTTYWIHFAVRPKENRRKILFDCR